MKRYRLLLLALVIIAQLAVPAFMVVNKYDILRNGVEIKFEVRPVDPYDAFRGRYVSISPNIVFESRRINGIYGILEVSDGGFATVKEITNDKPNGELYIKSSDKEYFHLPIDRYYMEEKLAPKAEKIVAGQALETYVTVRVKNGNAVVSGLYVSGTPIEEYVNKFD